jgi:hypothetical protein
LRLAENPTYQLRPAPGSKAAPLLFSAEFTRTELT